MSEPRDIRSFFEGPLQFDSDVPSSSESSNTNSGSSSSSEPNCSNFASVCDIACSKDHSPVQPILSTYPKQRFSARANHFRSFQPSWFSKFQWLEYSVQEDKAYCFPCRFFRTGKESAFTAQGFNDWKHAFGNTSGGEERGVLETHESSTSHKGAMISWLGYIKTKDTGSIMTQLSSSYAKDVEVNRYYIKTIAEIILFCALHDLPLRGHSEDRDALTRGVFLDFVDLVARHDSSFKDKLKSIPNNAKYLSSDIQNEMLSILSQMVLAMIRKECASAKLFSVSADETKDNSKNELLTVSLRYYSVSAFKVKEVFTGFVNLTDLGAENIAKSVVSNVEDTMKLSMSNCISSTFDGASTMSGAITGVQARLKILNPNMLYTHCFNHVLNLCLVDTVKSVDNARCFFDLLQALYVFISGSAIHIKFIEFQKEDSRIRHAVRLKKQCETRWACIIY